MLQNTRDGKKPKMPGSKPDFWLSTLALPSTYSVTVTYSSEEAVICLPDFTSTVHTSLGTLDDVCSRRSPLVLLVLVTSPDDFDGTFVVSVAVVFDWPHWEAAWPELGNARTQGTGLDRVHVGSGKNSDNSPHFENSVNEFCFGLIGLIADWKSVQQAFKFLVWCIKTHTGIRQYVNCYWFISVGLFFHKKKN